MIRGYVSSDEEDEDDFFYSEPPVKRQDVSTFPHIQNVQIREKLHSALEHSKKVSLFLTAVDRNDLTTLEELISLGVSVDSSLSAEWTPLLKACSLCYPEVVEFLLEHGANPNLQKELFSPLMACCTNNYISEQFKLSCVRHLMQHGANVNLTDKYRMTALMYAADGGYKEIVNELLSSPDIDVNIQDKEGSTALFYAVKTNDCILVQRLIDAGADINLKDRNDRSAVNVALLNDCMNVAKILGYSEESELGKFEKTNKNFSSDLVTDFFLFDEQMFFSDTDNIFDIWHEFELKQKVSFPKFLNMTASDLLDVGIVFEHDRRKIQKNIIHRYHLHPWKKSSMPEISNDAVLVHDLVVIAANIMKHLVIGNSSLQYINSRISVSVQENMKNLSTVKELISVLATIHSTCDQLKCLLFKILHHSDKIRICTEDDFIQPMEKHNSVQKKINFKCYCYVIGAIAGSYFLYRHFIVK